MSKQNLIKQVRRRDLLIGAAALTVGSISTFGCDSGGDDGDSKTSGAGGKADDAVDDGDLLECVGGELDPDEALSPIKNVVVLMMENRSFDHYFGSLSLNEGRTDVDGLRGDEKIPGPKGQTAELFQMGRNEKMHHLPHKWEPMHDAFNGGKNDGFALAHHEANKEDSDTAFREVMGFMTREELPIMYALADNYTLCDKWFCSVMGPTWPNRFYLHAASAGGRTSNRPKFFMRTIWGRLRDADRRGINYFGDIPWAAGGLGKLRGLAGLGKFFKHAERGELPEFSVIDPGFFSSSSDHPKEFGEFGREFGGNSDHPEMGPNTDLGQLLIATIYKALAASPQWNETMFVITYDESGGLFDHVPPPKTIDEREEFEQLGFRVPSLVIGPHMRRGCVNHNQFEHVSVITTASRRFDLEPLNDRVLATNDLSSCVHPDLINDPQPGIDLPKIEIDEEGIVEKLVPTNTQPELLAMAQSGDIPKYLDQTAHMEAQVRGLISTARKYGVVRDRLKAR